MRKLIGKRISSELGREYLLTDIAGQGAQGIVFEESSGDFMIKLYFPTDEITSATQVKKIIWLLQQAYPERFIMPSDIILGPFIGYVMKRVKGHIPLNRLLIPSREMSFSEWYNDFAGGLRRRLFLGFQTARSFHLLHKENRAYCDISGSNILVAKKNSIASVCMIDIDNLYVPGTYKAGVLGTPRYMAPEISLANMQPDILTDDYSLAVILFEILRIGHPYVGDQVAEGTPEMESEAYKGTFPYVDDDRFNLNKPNNMLPAEVVFTPKLRQMFTKTFIEGKQDRMNRATAVDFAHACLEASNQTVKCGTCASWYYFPNQSRQNRCPWCDNDNSQPNFLYFGDDYKLIVRGTVQRKNKLESVYTLRKARNHITSNYIIRDMDVNPSVYFQVAFSPNTKKYYVLNPDNNQVWYLHVGSTTAKELTSFDQQELSKDDIIYFSDPSVFTDDELMDYKGKIRRYAQFK